MHQPDEILIPRSVDEVLSILDSQPSSARVVAGNTTMFEFLSRGLADDVKVLVDISEAGLSFIEEKEDGVHIGAGVTLLELASSSLLIRDPTHSVVAETAQSITPTQIRNVATVGGEICSAIPFFDLPVSLLALNASVVLRRKTGQRRLNLQDFFVDFVTSALEDGELLTEVILPKDDNPSGAAFLKLGRTASDFAVVNVAASLGVRSGNCISARIWLGGVASTFHRCSNAESRLLNSKLDQNSISKAAESAADFEPTASIHASPSYKRQVIPILVRDCILHASKKVKA